MAHQGRNKGAEGEEKALSYLKQQGLSLVQRNYRCKGGEIDLIMRDGDTLVFVEVRQRNNMRFGGAAASINKGKQVKLVKAAQHYLQKQSIVPPCRFDVVALEGDQLIWLNNVIQL